MFYGFHLYTVYTCQIIPAGVHSIIIFCWFIFFFSRNSFSLPLSLSPSVPLSLLKVHCRKRAANGWGRENNIVHAQRAQQNGEVAECERKRMKEKKNGGVCIAIMVINVIIKITHQP